MTKYNVQIEPGIYRDFEVITVDYEIPWNTRIRLIKQVIELAQSKGVIIENIVFHGFSSSRTFWTLCYDFLPSLSTDTVKEKMDKHFRADRALKWAEIQLKHCFGDKKEWGVR